MKTHILVATLAALAIFSFAAVSAQEEAGARLIVVLSGSYIASNDILSRYADAMDLKSIENLAKAHEDDVVPFTDLIGKLPQPLQGWTGDDPDGMNMEMVGLKYSFAERNYNKNEADDEVDIVIYDTVNSTLGPWYGFWYGGMSYESTDGYARVTTYKGYPAWESRSYQDNEGALAIGLVASSAMPEMGTGIWVASGLLLMLVARKKVAA